MYSSPTEKINRKMVDIKKVRMAKGLTPTMVTKAKDPNIAVQIRPESLGSSSGTENTQGQHKTRARTLCMADYSKILKCFLNKRLAFTCMLYKTTKHYTILLSYPVLVITKTLHAFFFKSETFTFLNLIKWVEECH